MAGGILIHHEVFQGNTVDPKTLESTISVLKDLFRINNVILIADRALGHSGSLDLLDQNLYIMSGSISIGSALPQHPHGDRSQ